MDAITLAKAETALAPFKRACIMIIVDAPTRRAVTMAAKAVPTFDIDEARNHAAAMLAEIDFWPTRSFRHSEVRKTLAQFASNVRRAA